MAKNDLIFVGLLGAICLLVSLLVPIQYLPFVWGGIGLLIVIILWANFFDLMTLILLWFITVACFSYFFWKQAGIGGLNVTIDRLVILVIVITAFLGWMIGRLPIKQAPTALKIILVMLLFFTISLVHSGFRSISEVSPHFRLAGGYYFPTIALVLTYFAVNDEPQIKKIVWFFFAFGVYLTITAWAEHFELWEIVFPRYIADPELGIHWTRSRGPFLVSACLGITLVFCFFSNVFLAARSQGPVRPVIYAVNLLMLPAIFFTQTRSVWLAMVVCLVMWILLSRRIENKAAVLMLLLALLIVVVAVFKTNILSRERPKGGVTDPFPVYARFGLMKITGQIFQDHPIFGVGFGHFRDYATKYAQDPSSKYIKFGSRLIEHNNFLSILAECGLVGLILYVLVLVNVFKHSRALYSRIPPDASGWVSRDLVILYWILMADYLIDAMFRETSVDPFNNGLFFVFTGLILAVDYLLDYRPQYDRITPIAA